MKIALCYVFPTVSASIYHPMAKHFVATYLQNPPGKTEHEIHIAVNGGVEYGKWTRELFHPLPCHFFQHNNYGKDIGCYFAAADTVPCDLLVCLGAPVHFHKSGWLDRIRDTYQDNGPALYGAWAFHFPLPHIRTTAFWIPPDLLLAYPHPPDDRGRYGFEHGPQSLTLWTQQQGFEPKMVSWSGVYDMPHWHTLDRNESLMVDQHMIKHQIK